MRRPELTAAWIVGIALPVLETLRRRTDFSSLPNYVDDYVAGGLLLWAAFATTRGRWYGPGLLIAAWGILCGGLYYSFFGQLATLGTQDISGLPSAWVAIIKGAFFALALAAVALSVRAHRRSADVNPANANRASGTV